MDNNKSDGKRETIYPPESSCQILDIHQMTKADGVPFLYTLLLGLDYLSCIHSPEHVFFVPRLEFQIQSSKSRASKVQYYLLSKNLIESSSFTPDHSQACKNCREDWTYRTYRFHSVINFYRMYLIMNCALPPPPNTRTPRQWLISRGETPSFRPMPDGVYIDKGDSVAPNKNLARYSIVNHVRPMEPI